MSTPTTWCRGQSPTQGRGLCCHAEQQGQEPISNSTPDQGDGDRAVADATRYPEGGTSRALSGQKGTNGHTKGEGGKRGQEERTGKPQPNKNQEQKQEKQQKPSRKKANKTRHPQPNETETRQETQRPANARHKRDN